jgi:4-aminobutyrate aminotransferase-like enzyme
MSEKSVTRTSEMPGPESKKIIEELKRYEFPGPLYADFLGTGVHMPIFKEADDGIHITDVDGNVLMDTHAAMACITLGYRNKDAIEAAKKQMDTLPAVLAMGPSLPRIQLAKMLVEECVPDSLRNHSKIMFDTGGSAAIDLSLKMALFHAAATKKNRRNVLLAFTGGYHGNGPLGMFASDIAMFRGNYPYRLEVARFPYPYCYRCPFNLEYPGCDLQCVEFIDKSLRTPTYGFFNPLTRKCDVTSLIVEPLQSHGGTIVPPDEFYPRLRKLCDDFDITFVDDEICGFMWSGKYWFCCEHYKTTPDIMIVAKGFAGGLGPLGAVIVSDKISDELIENKFWYMTTYQGHPVSCAAALANLKAIRDKKVLDRVEEKGKYILKRMNELKDSSEVVGDVRGKGFMVAMEFVKNKDTKEPAPKIAVRFGYELLKRGATGYTGLGDNGNVMHWHLPLCIQQEEIDQLLSKLDSCLDVIKK